MLLVWQVFYAGPKLKEEQERRQRIQQEQSAGQGAAGRAEDGPEPLPPARSPQPGSRRALGSPGGPAATREAALETSPRVRIDTPSLRGSIALKGGRIDDLVLAKYHETVDPTVAQCRAVLAVGRAASLLRRVRLGGGQPA